MPYLEKVKRGKFQALLPKPPIEWAMKRRTIGQSKLVLMTNTDFEQRVACGARGLRNFVYRTKR